MPRLRQAAVVALALLLLGVSLPAAASPSPEPAAPAACPLVIKNGTFEAQGANWTQSGAGSTQLISNFNPHTGKYGAYLGGVIATDHSITQQVSLPNQSHLMLSFWWEEWTQETAPGDLADYLTVNLLNSSGGLLKELAKLGVDPDRPPWDKLSFDLSGYAGQTVRIQFLAHNDGSNPTDFFVDDVSIPACHNYLPTARR